MTDEIKCPVCGKVGIPDYLNEDTVCPQCGSDLSIFRVIDQIPQPVEKKKNVWMPIAAAAILVAAVCGGILLFRPAKVVQIGTHNEQIAMLQDSIGRLNEKLEVAAQVPTTQSNEFKYVVRKGDSFWSISKRFYHTGTRYEEVAAANGLDSQSKLTVGDTIIVKQ